MARDCSTTFSWADGEYTFRLKLGQVRELQEKCDAGPRELAIRLASGKERVDDVRETIRLGLIGGGLTPEQALKLVKRYVDERPFVESIMPAQAILSAWLVGAPDEEPGKAEAVETRGESPSYPEGNSASPPSTEPVPS